MIVAIANIVLAIIALVRESRLAAFAGTTGTADAFMLALYLPDLVGNTVLAGGITFAAVPVLSTYRANGDPEGFKRTLGATTGLLLMLTLALSALGWFAAPFLIARVGAGLSEATRSLTGMLFSCLLPGVPFFVLTALFNSALYVLGRFAFPAFGPVVQNLVFLSGLLFLAPILGVEILAISFTIGTVAMFLLQLLPLMKSGHLDMPTADWTDPGLRGIVHKSWPVMAGILLTQPGGIVEKMLASNLVEGSIAGLSYAFKLSQFPIWVFAAAIGTVIFPALALSAGERDFLQFRRVLTEGLVLTMFICLPFTVVFVILGRPIVSLLFQHGAFDINSLGLTSSVLSTYALGLGAQGLAYLFLRAFYSLGDMITPMNVAVVSTIVTVASDMFFVRRWGLPGLGLGTSIGTIVQAMALGHFLSRRVGYLGRGIVHSIWRIGVASFSLAAMAYFLNRLLLRRVEGLDLPTKVWRVGLVLGIGGLVYIAICLALRVPKVRMFWPEVRPGIRSE
ncbi:MAG: murein biosynthesis integral membrane protein MurJ [Firmicutes bacterium]|nr:murein biosynthesis integral membrane protein MurJ [Bacillota bacterium]